jgi:hypothetical protein
MKIISTILLALIAFIGGVAALYGLSLGVIGIFDAWLGRKGRKK